MHRRQDLPLTRRHDCRIFTGIMPDWPAFVRDRSLEGYVAAASMIREKGLPLDALHDLVALGFSMSEVQELVINPRTLRHRRLRGERLSAEESDRAVRLARTLSSAERTFGDRERAWRWLRKANRSLGGHRPLDLLATETGARAVEESLVRLDEGMFV
ncbi:MAG: type II RES/Xre toxin-antitoxin system antitoxin [Candidatus Binatia bacterium]